MFLSCFIEVFFLESHGVFRWKYSRYSNECNCSYYGLIFITSKYNAMSKSWLWPQNWLRQTCNVFVFTFIKHIFKRRDVLQIKCLVEKVINHIVLIWTISFNVKQVKQKALKVCIIWPLCKLWVIYHPCIIVRTVFRYLLTCFRYNLSSVGFLLLLIFGVAIGFVVPFAR